MANQAITKSILSGSTNGMGILLPTTNGAGSTLHTAVSGTSAMDEIFVYFTNVDATDREVTIEYGDANSNNKMYVTIAAKSGLVLGIPGLILNNAKVLKAYCAAGATYINAFGYVHNIV